MNMQTINLSNFYLIGEFIFQGGQVAVKLVYDVSPRFGYQKITLLLLTAFIIFLSLFSG